jgi:hypothetical protein
VQPRNHKGVVVRLHLGMLRGNSNNRRMMAHHVDRQVTSLNIENVQAAIWLRTHMTQQWQHGDRGFQNC